MMDDARHAEKMAKKKAARDKIMAGKTEEKGLLIVHTGKGKGKTSAAMGMAVRCIAHGLRVGIIQFIKGAMATGEREVFQKFPDLCTIQAMGEGFSWESQDKERDRQAAQAAWESAKSLMADPSYRMVILDELNIVLRYDDLDREEVIKTLAEKRPDLHVVVTGRNAPDALIEAADLVTEMELVKHPFRSGIKAQPGIEF